MAFIRGGSFMLGSLQGDADEKPVKRTTLQAYCVDLQEVTVKDYAACVNAASCAPQSDVDWTGISDFWRKNYSESCNWGKRDRDSHPINCVDWRQASAYCAWAGKRLPTEPEWEYAARGSDGRLYPWGNHKPTPRLLNACSEDDQRAGGRVSFSCLWGFAYAGGDGHPTTAPVGSFPQGRSPFGVHDLAGNVREWTSSPLCPYDAKDCVSVARVQRGSGWGSDDPQSFRATFRTGSIESYRDHDLGFRCARDP
jgi:formylglycine-generating enzyme required for sulfatase activity